MAGRTGWFGRETSGPKPASLKTGRPHGGRLQGSLRLLRLPFVVVVLPPRWVLPRWVLPARRWRLRLHSGLRRLGRSCRRRRRLGQRALLINLGEQARHVFLLRLELLNGFCIVAGYLLLLCLKLFHCLL